MAAPVVQQKAVNYNTGPQTLTFPSTVTSGNLLVACVYTGSGAFTVTVSDSIGSSWSRQQQINNAAAGHTEIWSALAASSAADTVTFAITGGSSVGGWVFEVSGGYTATADKTNTNFGNPTVPVGANFTGLASTTDFVIYEGLTANNTGTLASGGIWTNDYTSTLAGGHYPGIAYATTGTTVTGPGLITAGSDGNVVVGAAFSAGPPTVNGTATVALGPLTLTATGTNIPAGTASLPLGPLTLSSTGTVLALATGTAALPLGPLSLASLTSDLISLGPLRLAAAGTVVIPAPPYVRITAFDRPATSIVTGDR